MLFYRNVLGSLAVSQCWSWGEITGAGIYFLAWLVVAALCAGGIRDVISEAICHSLSPPSNLPNRTISSSLYLRVCVYVTHNSSSIQWWCGHTRWQCCYLDVSWRHSQKRCFQHGYKDVLLDELVSCFSAVIVWFGGGAVGWRMTSPAVSQDRNKWREIVFEGLKIWK